MKPTAALQLASGKSSRYLASVKMRKQGLDEESKTVGGADMWQDVGQGGHLADFKGACGGGYDDEDSSSDALSSTSSTNTSTSTLSEEDELMEEVNAASFHLQQITQQALDLLDDMQTDTTAPASHHSRYSSSFSQSSATHHTPRPAAIREKVKRSKKSSNSKSSRRKLQSDQTNNLNPQNYHQRTPQRESFVSLQLKTHDIVQSAQNLLKSIERDSCSSFAQQQISEALQQHRLEYHRRQALTQQQQIIYLQQTIQQQRRQLKRSRRQSKHSRLSRSVNVCGRLSPIPEVHTPASSVTHE